MTEYRTREQFEEIIESAINGNWTQAGEECVEYGFYANDLIKQYEEIENEFGCSPYQYFDKADIARIVEIAAKIRYEEV